MIKNKQGELGSVNKNILEIAPEYQRSVSPKLVRTIGQSWDWHAAGALIVNKRDDRYFVVDGQHRYIAAQGIDDINRLPCIIHQDLSIEQEARLFYIYNSDRKNVTAFDRFRAACVFKDEIALFVRAEVEKVGFEVANKGVNSVTGIASLLDVARENRDRFKRCLSVASGLCKDSSMRGSVFKALSVLDKKIGLKDARLVDRMLEIGLPRLYEGMRLEQLRWGNQRATTNARGILKTVNEGLKHKFQLED